MMTFRYVIGGLRHRLAEAIAATIALALVVAYLASLGSFVQQTGGRLTVRAAAAVPVDWQVQVTAGANPAAVGAALGGVPGVTGFRMIDYAKVTGLSATTPGGKRTTGTAYVVSISGDYSSFAPGEIRSLVGPTTGVLLQQQTASNLAVAPGAQIDVVGAGSSVRIDGVVDLPFADSFFQVVGAPAGSGAAAPPDNVVLVPRSDFAALVGNNPVVHQLHVRFDHGTLPSAPAAAADEITHRANHYVAAVAGGALVGDNLGAALSAAREDAIYAQLLVLLLGVPGLVLAAVVAGLVLSLRLDRQRRDLALLRLRGATPRRSAWLLGLTAAQDGLLGAVLGVGGAVLTNRIAFGPGTSLAVGWIVAGVATSIVLAVFVELAPVVRLLGGTTPTVSERVGPRLDVANPLPLRLYLDVILLAASAITFGLTARGGYQVVVVPEGVPVASVNYAALLAPAMAWPGLALLVWRLTAVVLHRRSKRPATDPSGVLRDLRHEVVRRRRRVIARGATGLAVAIAAAVSTSVFTTTYDRQARVDVALTVGSDVAVTLPADSPTGLNPAIASVAGVTAVEQVSHRLAYVGPDLQDLYAIDARTIGRAAPLQDAFTPGSSVKNVLRDLAQLQDGVLLSQETLRDYQLHPGDLVRLRLRAAQGGYRTVAFHVVGVVTEFATAPRDSFVIANRSYVAAATGVDAVQTLLVRTSRPQQVAAQIHAPAPAVVDNISAPRSVVPSASGLAAGSLSGLARLTLMFALLLASASSTLVLLVGVAQRRRSMAALSTLGASRRQRAGFVWTEARAVIISGTVGGLLAGAVVAEELVKVLNGIFDPAPTHPAFPVAFLSLLLGVVLGAGAVATLISARRASTVDASALRDL